jgi:hypothetical protein
MDTLPKDPISHTVLVIAAVIGVCCAAALALGFTLSTTTASQSPSVVRYVHNPT